MSDFTPGPWQESWDYKRLGADNPYVIAHACGPQHHCKGEPIDERGELLQPNRSTMAAVYADARLVAAAPELYDALRKMRALLVDRVDVSTFGPPEYDCLRDADIALAKARGESS